MDAEHTRRRLWRGAGFGVIAWAGPLILGIVLTPTIVRGLGEAEYGLYALVVGLVSFSSTALLGRAVVRRVAAAHATDQLHTGVEMVRSAAWLAGVGGLAITVLLWSAGNWLAQRAFHLPGGDYRTAFGLVGAGIAAAIVSQVFASVLHGLHRFDVYARVVTVTSVAAAVGCAVLAARGHGALSLIVWTVVVAWVGSALYIISARRLLAGAPPARPADGGPSGGRRGPIPPSRFALPPSRFAPWRTSWRTSRRTSVELLTHSSAVAVYQICGYALVIAERAFVVRTMGVETLTYYVVAMNVAMPIHGLIAGSTLAVLPTASAAEARQVDVAHVYLRSSRWANMVVVWLTLTAVVCADAFLRVWMGEAFADRAAMLLRVHTLTFGVLAMQVVAWQVAEGWGLARANAWFTVWWLASALILMPWLGAHGGAVGVALARFAGLLAVPVFVAFVERRVLGAVRWRAWLSGALGLTPAALVSAAVQYVILQQLATGWLGLMLAVLTGAGAYLTTLYVVGFVDRRDLLVAQWLWRDRRAQASS